MTLGERVKEARKSSGMTQQELADGTGVKRGTIASIEVDSGTPSDRTIRDISRACGVSELWLRTGEGEMHAPPSRAQEIADFVAGMTGGWCEQKQRIICAICSVDDPGFWEICLKVAESLVASKDDDPPKSEEQED